MRVAEMRRAACTTMPSHAASPPPPSRRRRAAVARELTRTSARMFSRAMLARAAFTRAFTRAYAPRIAFEDFAVGANVIINAPSTNTRVVVTASEVMEVVEIETDDLGPTYAIERTDDGNVRISSDASASSEGGGDVLRVTIPPRFCGVDVTLGAAGASASISSIVEATLRVRTNGGDIELGSIKGASVDVDTNGGAIRARTVSADTRARTNGGSMTMSGKLVGSLVYVDTAPGGSFMGESIFGDKVNINTGGGAVHAKSLRVSEIGVVRSDGGRIDVDGVEGAGEEMIALDSGGGDINVKFAERVHIVHVNSRGGTIEASFPSGFAAPTHVVGSYLGKPTDGRIDLPSTDDGLFTAHARVVHGSNDEIARKVSAGAEGASVTLDSDGASIDICATSWIASALAASKRTSTSLSS